MDLTTDYGRELHKLFDEKDTIYSLETFALRIELLNALKNSGQIEPQVKPEIAEIKKENKKFKEAIKKIYQTSVCVNNNIGKWVLEEYCYNLLNDSNFTA